MLFVRDLDANLNALGLRTVIIEAVALFFATVALGLRIWTRRISKRPLCFNDWAIIFAWVSGDSASSYA